MRSGWLFAHIAMIFTGYAALFLSFTASLLYLAHEKALKSKQTTGITSRLPALSVIDDIGSEFRRSFLERRTDGVDNFAQRIHQSIVHL